MPLLPSHTLLQTYSLTLLLTSYLLLTSPTTILSSTPLWLLGESMRIKPASFTPLPQSPPQSPPTLSKPTRELLSLLSLLLFLGAITQSILSSPLRYSLSDLTSLATKSISQKDNRDLEAEDNKSAFAEKLYNLHSTQTIFLTLSAVRVLGEGALVAYIYLFFSTRAVGAGGGGVEAGTESVMGMLANRIVFTVVMGDMLFWGYMWTVLRDEAREVAGLVGKRRGMEEEMEMK